MTYLLIIFISPLYFLIKGKWGGLVINSIFYGTALILLVTIIGAFLAPIPWIIAMVHGMSAYRKQILEESTTMMAAKMATAMRQPPEAGS